MSDPVIVLEQVVTEEASCQISGRLVSPEFPNGIPTVSLTSLRGTLYCMDAPDFTVLNGFDNLDLLSSPRCVLDTTGGFKLTLHPADNPIIDDTLLEEPHRIRFDFGYNGGLDMGRQPVEFLVRNLERLS